MKAIVSPLLASLLFAGTMSAHAEVAPVRLPEPQPGQYLHKAPTLEDLETDQSLKPQLKEVIRKGYDLFMNTQQLRGEYVFNDMNCRSCHMGEGRKLWAAPIWPAATTLPDFRGKNQHVNSLEERISGCFSFSMNGKPPAYGSDSMLSLVAYHQWLAKGAPVYESNIAGRSFGKLAEPAQKPDFQRGAQVYADNCAICHGSDGQGQLSATGAATFPPLWGDGAYNWGAGMARIHTAAAFIKHNMPLGQGGKLTDQQAWDVAYFVNGHERPQDPRYLGDAKKTRDAFMNFHQFTLYGTEVEGRLLGQHDNTGEKPFLKPDVLKPRTFSQGSTDW